MTCPSHTRIKGRPYCNISQNHITEQICRKTCLGEYNSCLNLKNKRKEDGRREIFERNLENHFFEESSVI
jgi:hypothetical protein